MASFQCFFKCSQIARKLQGCGEHTVKSSNRSLQTHQYAHSIRAIKGEIVFKTAQAIPTPSSSPFVACGMPANFQELCGTLTKLNKYPNLVYKEFFWEKRGDHGPVEHNASFDNMVQTLQRWVGLDVVPKTSTGHSKHIRDHIQHKGLSTSTESSPIYTSLKNRIHEMKLEYLDSLSTNTRGLATQDSAAFVECSHRFEMKESQIFK